MSSNTSNTQVQPRISANARTISALIGDVLRNSFPQRLPRVPKKCYTKDWSYMYSHDTVSLKLQNIINGEDPMIWSKRVFDQIILHSKYNDKWVGTPTLQKDHAMDLQHIIQLTFGPLTDGAKIWDIAPYGAYLHLSFFVNDQRNSWMLPGPLNNVKGRIDTANWDPKRTLFKTDKDDYVQLANAEKEFIRQYLFGYSDGEGRTPFSELMSLSTEMIGLPPSDLTRLTIMAGKAILNCMRAWAESTGINSYTDAMSKAKNSQIGIQDLMGNFSENQKERRSLLEENARKGVGIFSGYFDKVDSAKAVGNPSSVTIEKATGHFESVLDAAYAIDNQNDSMDTT